MSGELPDWAARADEFEQRLRDVGAIGGDCLACGGPAGRERLDRHLFSIDSAAGSIPLYGAICPTCGHVEWFSPIVFAAWETPG